MEGMFIDEIELLEKILDGIAQPTKLSLLFLNFITDNFSDKRVAGRGGYGVVYKGEFKNRTIAVKKINFNETVEKDFDREIQNLMRVNHQNIVRFLGYCDTTEATYVNMAKPGEAEKLSSVCNQERIICFEYISNGSLTRHINDELRGLEWHTRYKIIKEVCLALHYLHDKKKFVHRDLKPDNILIDNLMVPKVSDLGLSKILDDGASKAIATNAAFTWGYAPPEYKDHLVTFSYDIYSLGVIIIQIVTGFMKPRDVKHVLTRWRHRWNKTDETLRYQQVAKCIEIGLLCKHENPKKRPSISKILKKLNDLDGDNGAVQQDIPFWNDMLWVEPPELFFPFQVNKKISSSLKLHNKADAYMAFFIKTDSELMYRVHPRKGIIEPQSHLSVNITLLETEEGPEIVRNDNVFTVKSKKINESLADKDITKDIFSKKTNNNVDEVMIDVVFESRERANCCISTEDLSLEISRRSTEALIRVNPLEFCFPAQQKEVKSCLQIVNITDDYVAFNLVPQKCLGNYTIPCPRGVLTPRSTMERVIIRSTDKEAPTNMKCKEVVILHSTTVSNGFEERDITYDIFQKEMGRMVQDMDLSFVPIQTSRPQPVAVTSVGAWTIDTHPTEPLILLTGSHDFFHMWNYRTQKFTRIAIAGNESVGPNDNSFKKAIFIPRMQWMVASTGGGLLFVLSYDHVGVKLIHTLRKHVGDIVSCMAVHATEPYMVSASYSGQIVLWNYENNWEIKYSFGADCHQLIHVAFNPSMPNTFASADFGRIQIWDINSNRPKRTFRHSLYTLYSNFFTRGDKQYLISGCDSGTAKIWDLKTDKCVQTLEGHSDIKMAVCHPDLPLLITGSSDGSVYLWNSNNLRLERILSFGFKQVTSIACTKGSTRIVISFTNGVVVADIGPQGSTV